jgi:hypothetical protein
MSAYSQELKETLFEAAPTAVTCTSEEEAKRLRWALYRHAKKTGKNGFTIALRGAVLLLEPPVQVKMEPLG